MGEVRPFEEVFAGLTMLADRLAGLREAYAADRAVDVVHLEAQLEPLRAIIREAQARVTELTPRESSRLADFRAVATRVEAGEAWWAEAQIDRTLASWFGDDWSAERDLVVLVGTGSAPWAAGLERLGQGFLVEDVGVGSGSLASLETRIMRRDGTPTKHVMIRPVPGTRLSPAQQEALQAAARRGLNAQRVQQRTRKVHGPTWRRQGLANLEDMGRLPCVTELDGRFRGVPCVIAAPGPSLEGELEQLLGVDKSALIIGLSGALRALGARRRPHLVPVLDAGPIVVSHFSDVDLSEVTLALSGVVDRRLFTDLNPGGRAVFGTTSDADSWIYDALGRTQRLGAGGSVACTALDLALHWGCDPIVFIGLDLSFPRGQFYAESAFAGQQRTFVDGNAVRVDAGGTLVSEWDAVRLPAIVGGDVLSTGAMAIFHAWFVRAAAEVAGRVRLVNCSVGGARIEGMEHSRFQDVRRGLPELGRDLRAEILRWSTTSRS